MLTFGVTYSLRALRDRILLSGNFFNSMQIVKGKYGGKESMSVMERQNLLKEKKLNPYEEIKQQRMNETAQKGQIKSRKPQKILQNPNPFQMKV